VCAFIWLAADSDSEAVQVLILPGTLPSRDMLANARARSKAVVQAIGALEGAIRNCNALRAANGMQTSASEDILQARISRLRYGLYAGEIPYAVYNYGLAQALRKHTAFMVRGRKGLHPRQGGGRHADAWLGFTQSHKHPPRRVFHCGCGLGLGLFGPRRRGPRRP